MVHPRNLSMRPDQRADQAGGIAKVLVITVAIVAVLGFAGYWFFIRSDAAPKPTISQTKTVPGDSVDGTWTLVANDADGSFVQYRITETFAAGLVDNTATGQSPDVTGSLTINGTEVSDVTVTANLAALKSDRDVRDNQLKGRGLETDRFPTATFTATGPFTLAAAPKKGVTVTTDVTGDLTLHGVTKEVTIPIEGRWDGAKIQIIGDLPILLADYDITAPSGGPIASIETTGNLELKLFFTKTG